MTRGWFKYKQLTVEYEHIYVSTIDILFVNMLIYIHISRINIF